MRRAVVFLAAVAAVTTNLGLAQSTPVATTSDRKIASRVAPTYPELAKKMHIRGMVKVEAVVRPNGSVKSTRVLGGNPVLVDAAGCGDEVEIRTSAVGDHGSYST